VAIPWQLWAPPLDPPVDGGLPVAIAQEIAGLYWASNPHLAAALMWEYFAATLDPTAAVAQVATGSQSVSYQPPRPAGPYGLAMAKAEWHRSFLGDLATVPLTVAGEGPTWPADWWQRDLEDRATWDTGAPPLPGVPIRRRPWPGCR
jgi:hypothetical protein